jgi:hypothetical protein
MSQEAGAHAFAWDATRRVRADADAKGYATPRRIEEAAV